MCLGKLYNVTVPLILSPDILVRLSFQLQRSSPQEPLTSCGILTPKVAFLVAAFLMKLVTDQNQLVRCVLMLQECPVSPWKVLCSACITFFLHGEAVLTVAHVQELIQDLF
jgi:hypothetical protein